MNYRWWSWHLHGIVSWSTGQSSNARGNDWQTANYISSKADGAKELEFSQSICCYGFCILSCRVCCWEGLMDLWMKIYIYIKHVSLILLPLIWVLFFFQARAKHDITNTAIAGCTTGGAISAKGNPLFHSFPVVYNVFVSQSLYLRNDGDMA